MDLELEELLEIAKSLPPPTPEQRFEGRASMIYGLLDHDSEISLEQVKKFMLQHEGKSP